MAKHLHDSSQNYVQAHRGFSEAYPENTLLAINQAFDAGADQVEIDLAVTRDGELVVLHDHTVDRTTDGSGAVSSYTLEELQQLDAGSWKNPAYAGQKIPTLEQALLAAKGRGALCIEIKVWEEARLKPELAAIAAKLSAEIRKTGMEHDVMVSSFKADALLEVQKADPELKLMRIDWEPPETGGLDNTLQNGFFCWSPKPALADADRISRAVEAGVVVQVDIYNLNRVKNLLDYGVRGFSADEPKVLISQLELVGAKRAAPPTNELRR